MIKILLTGFGSFLGHDENPSLTLIKTLDNFSTLKYQVVSEELPVIYDDLNKLIPDLLDKHSPDFVISIGLAADRKSITPELIAVNLMHSSSPDNSGIIKNFEKIFNKSNEAFTTTLPIKEMIKKVQEENIPCELSTDAGSYICNKTMYLFSHHIKEKKLNIKSGFIHIPEIIDQSTLEKAFKIMINEITGH